MLKHDSILMKTVRWIQNWLVHTVVIPNTPFDELNLDANRPMVYVMKTESISDLAALNEITQEHGFPSPYEPLEIKGEKLARVVSIEGAKPLFGQRLPREHYLKDFLSLFNIHKQYSELDVQLVPVSLYWGRTPGKEDDTMKAAVFERENPTWLRKCLMILFLGRHNFIQFSNSVSLRHMVDEHGSDKRIAQKLARVARFHFARQRKVMTGPELPSKQNLINSLLNSSSIQQAIEEEANSKKISTAEARQRAEDYINEISANYSDSLIRISERFLTWLWNKLYKGINIKGAERVRQLHHDGHEIVYVPCHRSHMDYLLLSYILYYEGMVPPHIAAGINLDFWPAGPMFRKCGAFFIRRSFKGNKLYTTVFRTYLDQLFTKGYSVEYFTEGGRSRTGRLLSPKTGMVAMTVNSVLRGVKRPVTLVPVYLGYDHVMEVATYHKELSGKKKQKESVWQVFGAIRKLGNFGQGYVNFGEPISLQNFLNEQVPSWREDVASDPEQKPTWLTPVVNNLANQVMVHINGAAAVSSVTLTSLVLLASEQNALERSQLVKQLNLYLTLFKQLPYTEYTSVVDGDGEQLVEQSLELKKINLEQDALGEIISIDKSFTTSMTYYRNNIIHLLALPSLVASCLAQSENNSKIAILAVVENLFPLLQAELFMKNEDLESCINQILALFIEQGLIQGDDNYTVVEANINQLLLLQNTMSETLQRYAIIFNLLAIKPNIERAELESESHKLAKRLGALHGITAPEFYDKKLYGTLSVKLKALDYLTHDGEKAKVVEIKEQVNALLNASIRQTIVDSVVTDAKITASVD